MSKQILIAEDSSVLQNLMKKILGQASGFEITAVKNGVEVMKCVNEKQYDVLLLDINMPKLNGLECAKQIRALDDASKKDLPIIAISGNAMNMSEEEFKAVGINEFVPKPINFDSLIATVTKWLNR